MKSIHLYKDTKCSFTSNRINKPLSKLKAIISLHQSFIAHIGLFNELFRYPIKLQDTPSIHVSYLKKVVGQNCQVQTILQKLDEILHLAPTKMNTWEP